jgi:hypothetical protein
LYAGILDDGEYRQTREGIRENDLYELALEKSSADLPAEPALVDADDWEDPPLSVLAMFAGCEFLGPFEEDGPPADDVLAIR